MRLLLVHQNFPGQYKHMASALAGDPENEVVALTPSLKPAPAGVRVARSDMGSSQNARAAHPLAQDVTTKMIRGEAIARKALELKAQGFYPDTICGHPGWGEMLFLRDVWPSARILSYAEFYYRSTNSDLDFDPEFMSSSPELSWKIRAKNAAALLSLEASDWNVSPTVWQWKQLPEEYRSKTSVIHEGIDTDALRPDPRARIHLGRSRASSRPGDEIITFVNRNLEPYRGYHMFMRALPDILRRRPQARAVIVGGSGVSYGAAAPKGQTYKDLYLNEVQARLDMSRVHFVGNIPYEVYLNLLQVSAAHVYLTYPFVLSWSMLEAMAAGCLVIGSNTSPVLEVLEHQRNGLVVDFFSPQQIADSVVWALEKPTQYIPLRQEARRTIVERYDLKRVCLPEHLRLIRDVLENRPVKAGMMTSS